jgi:O-antigen ligase
MIVYLFLYFFVDPSRFIDTNFITLNPIRGYRFKIREVFLIFLFFYSFYKIKYEKDIQYLAGIIAVLILLLIFIQGRVLILCLVLSLAILFISLIRTEEQLVKYSLYFIMGALILFTLVYILINKRFVNTYVSLFNNVLKLFSMRETDEPGINVRIQSLKFAFDYIKHNPVFGAGILSSRWEGGYSQFSNQFHPGDIGVVGNIFAYGFIGLSTIYLPFFLSFRYSRKIKNEQDVFLKACLYTQLFLFIQSFFAASNIKYIGSIFLFTCIIFLYYVKDLRSLEKTVAE